MQRKTVPTLVAAATALALVVGSACSGSSGEPGDGEQAASPIDDLLGQPASADPDVMDAHNREAALAREEIVVECMAEQGFEHIPRDPEQLSFSASGDLDRGTEEWVERYGFGISTLRFSQEEVGPDLVGIEFPELDDPNEKNLFAMTEQEINAYYTALQGHGIYDVSEEELTEEVGGCMGEAHERVPWFGDLYMEFSNELEEIEARVDSDPRIVELHEGVATCVAEQGLTFTSEHSLREEYDAELLEIQQADNLSDEGVGGGDLSSMSEEEVDAIRSQVRGLSAKALDMLADLQARERELAAAVYECGDGLPSQSDLYREVKAEYEQEFIDTHSDELAKFESTGDGE